MSKPQHIIISISSDIGFSLAKKWLQSGKAVTGTYRTKSSLCDELEAMGANLLHCDLGDKSSVNSAIDIINNLNSWETLTLAAGHQEPVSMFLDCNFEHWEQSIMVNFSRQLNIVHGLMPNKSLEKSSVLFFAGGGTNNATIAYSAYTISKIALIKMVELLDAEILDTTFSILGPGWVKTKIHESTLKAADSAGANYEKTIQMLENNGSECYPMDKVVSCCDWLLSSPRELVGGRNFSAVHDPWESDKIRLILDDSNIFKLRRFGNDFFKLNNDKK